MVEVKKDCFGYNPRTGACTVMTVTICKRKTCSFYKTRKDYAEDLLRYPIKSNCSEEPTKE